MCCLYKKSLYSWSYIFSLFTVIQGPANFVETIIIFTVSFLQIVNDSNDTLFFIQMFPEDFFAKVSEPFLGGGEEWKDQYTEDNKIPFSIHLLHIPIWHHEILGTFKCIQA